MSDLPPANWYTDPQDESQYRYWDGSGWTEHRSPRHTESRQGAGATATGLRPSGDLITSSFSVLRRLWRGFLPAALINLVGIAVLVVGAVYTAALILDGEMGEVLDRISEPGFDPNAPQQREYFESLSLDWAIANFMPLVAGAVIAWLMSAFVTTAVIRATISDLHGRSPDLSSTLKQARQRTLRVMGVQLQIFAAVVLVALLLISPVFFAPLLLILTLPAMLVLVVAVIVLPVAYVAAATGPARPSLAYTLRLMRGRFWGTLGRLLLIGLILAMIGYGAGLLLGLATGAGDQLWNVIQLVNTAVGAVLALVATVASVIIYDDLGGESDPP